MPGARGHRERARTQKTKGGCIERDGTELFGHDRKGVARTWERLYGETIAYAVKKFGGYPREVVVDAASEGFAYVFTKWQFFPSSLTDDSERNWNFARKLARKRTGLWLRKELDRPETSFSELVPDHLSPEEQQDRLDAIVGPDERMQVALDHEESDLADRARAVIHELRDTQEWDWLGDLVAGLTEREAATRRGVSQQAINQRRKRGINRIQGVLKKHGLGKEASLA